MKLTLPSAFLLAASVVAVTAFTACGPTEEPAKKDSSKGADTGAASAKASAAEPEFVSKIDFSWRKVTGDFPKEDKPGYLILTTEDAVRWSKVLPEFVKQKEAMGFRVYLATEKDYGTGKTGNAQAASVRAWMREFHKRAGLKYALLIGDPGPRSANLPSPTIPDCERNGMDTAYCDLDGKWVDIYLNTTEKDTRPAAHQAQGSMFIGRAMKEGGKREDDLIMSRINYVGNEIGTGAYDLDRILDKTIRYERDTVAGKNLDWRSNGLSVTSNYGGADWDAPWWKAAEAEGAAFELRSTRGWLGGLPPQNTIDGRALNAELLTQTHRRGLVATMSHGWALGGEGIMSTGQLFRDLDPRHPAAVSVAACTAFCFAFPAHTGQAWLRTGAVFAIGTSWSGNNGARVPFHTRQLKSRLSVGEAANNTVVQYGDPSLHVLPPEGTPVRALQIAPVLPGRYEERTQYPDTPVKPVTQAYTLTNRSKEAMNLTVETDAPWLTLSARSLAIKPGETATVTATSNARADTLTPGNHVADVRFRRDDGQVDNRRIGLALQPLALTACYSFDAIEKGRQFSDLTIVPGNNRDVRSMMVMRNKTAEPGKKAPPGLEPVPGFGFEPQGRVGGALRLDSPAKGWSRGRLFNYPQWRGISTSFWFKLAALPAAKQSATILAAPFKVGVDSAGLLSFAGNAKPANLGPIKPGAWYFVQLRSDFGHGKVKAALNGAREVSAEATRVSADNLTLGSFTGYLDELKVWSGELTDAMVASEAAAAGKSFAPTPVEARPGVPLAEGGELRAPKEIPAFLDMKDPSVKLDIGAALAANGLTCTLRDAPEWLELKDGVIALKPGTDFDRIDFGGYDLFLVLTAKSGPFSGCVAEHPLKVRIPVPEVRIRIVRAPDNTLSIVGANAKQPLAKGVIRHTTDGSPVTEKSPVYTAPFKSEGDKVTARFFYLDEYPYAPVTMAGDFGISRELWKPLAVTGKGGKPGPLNTAALAFDGLATTAWKNTGGTLPQHYAWDLGRSETLTALSVHSNIKDAEGRIDGYNLLASDDGKVWRKVKTGEFVSSPNAQKIIFDAPVVTRHLKLEATSLHAGNDMVIVELEAYAK